MIGRLDKLIKPTGRRFAPCGGGRPPSSAGALLRDGPAVLDQSPVALRPRGRDGCAGRRAGQDQTAAARGVSAVGDEKMVGVFSAACGASDAS